MSESRWFCFNGVDEFKIFASEERTFEAAENLCAEEGATLGRISSRIELAAAAVLGGRGTGKRNMDWSQIERTRR